MQISESSFIRLHNTFISPHEQWGPCWNSSSLVTACAFSSSEASVYWWWRNFRAQKLLPVKQLKPLNTQHPAVAMTTPSAPAHADPTATNEEPASPPPPWCGKKNLHSLQSGGFFIQQMMFSGSRAAFLRLSDMLYSSEHLGNTSVNVRLISGVWHVSHVSLMRAMWI